MKRLILCILMLILGVSAYSQSGVFKLRAASNSVSVYNEETKSFGKWADPNPCNILIIVSKTTMQIYSKVTQNISIISCGEVFEKENGDTYFDLICVDGDGIRCNITVYLTKKTAEYSVFLQYSDIMFVYQCEVEK